MQLEWTPALSVGHKQIDKQHQELFQAFDDFIRGCARGEAKETLLKLHGYLQKYVDEHFRDEEALMTRCGYPDLEGQKRDHQKFQGRLAELRRDLEGDSPTLPVLVQTNRALVSWLVNHVQEKDRQLGQFLNEQRLR